MDNLAKELFNYLLQGNTKEAIVLMENAIVSNSHKISNYWYLGIAYLLNGEIETAQATWMSILWASDNIDKDTENLIQVLQNIGIKLLQDKRLNLAQLIYEQIINLDENNINSYYKLAYIYRDLGNYDEAELAFKHLMKCEINNPNIYLDYSNILLQQYRYDEIIEVLEKAINKFPQEQSLYWAIVNIFKSNGQAKKAITFAEHGLKINPNNLAFQMQNAQILPILYEKEAEIEYYHYRFTHYLEQIIKNLSLKSESEKKDALEAISFQANFYLQYQGKNTVKLQIKYGELVSKILSVNYPELSINIKNKNKSNSLTNNKIKIGYISSKMFDNVIGELFSGWIKYHNQQKFDIHCYYVGHKNDFITVIYRKHSNKFIHIQKNLELLCQNIISDQLDILVFLDLGMSPELTKIAGLRLAPIQCKAWGPPITSGSPMIDYFLTSNLMEHPLGEQHYSEKLVRLPNIALCYSPPKLPNPIKSRNYFNLPEDAVIYWSCQSLFKYLPQYDYIFPSIASQVSNSKFVFIKFPLSKFVNNQFEKRLENVFAQYGLEAKEYCIFLPDLTQDDFLNINLIADVNLDTFAWSGGKTAMEAISCNLPIVTCPGEFMRGRHSYGILKMIEVEETIAYSEREYIEIAVKLGNSLNWREKIKNKIKRNKHKLFNDMECIKGLEEFFVNAVANLTLGN